MSFANLNKSAIDETIAAIRAENVHGVEVRFDFNFWASELAQGTTIHDCETVGCIAGYAAMLYNRQQLRANVDQTRDRLLIQAQREGASVQDPIREGLWSNHQTKSDACQFLGLPYSEHWQLFDPAHTLGMDYEAVTPAIAIRVLEILRDTGSVDWIRAAMDAG